MQERCFALKAWFALVIYVCMHLSSKACRLLTTSASHPRSVRMVSSPCARFVRRWTSEHHQWSLLDGIGECSPPLAVSCLCYNTSSSAWMCNQAGGHLPVGCTYPCFSSARDMMPGYASSELIALAKQKREETSKLKILQIIKREYRDGIKS